jgi:hypothetical protein
LLNCFTNVRDQRKNGANALDEAAAAGRMEVVRFYIEEMKIEPLREVS